MFCKILEMTFFIKWF
uniref:Uncharacterized protein n=1 Tax=Arundo donax TaxID=35708 RepID=A0A0A8XZC9_ARUDO